MVTSDRYCAVFCFVVRVLMCVCYTFQVLPVVPKGDKGAIIGSCLKMWKYWPRVHQVELRTNMRVRMAHDSLEEGKWFASYLLRVGSGTEACVEHPYYNDVVVLPSDCIVQSLDELVDHAFPELDSGVYANGCVLAPLNAHCDEVNSYVCNLGILYVIGVIVVLLLL